ncbi:putative trans-sialidase, Group VI [Trypanosoma cruzi]|uniref:Trans-sialidase, putative n=2 Tax=Trypanosoma cruzi TaxID=5693 RepID=Q4DE01_TRYCC|nr:trans-sialidase, putative [Trypanosoma cruzi]EAN90756.1 trans-sialidase, putative [Trypanosoma cruzi]PWV15280.1 putative trans-sialidase, Group VI [Trypanosoma cruzi]|eukprot:XP_812607.1 trans-sialidase [Trypanosoma cruzi strain CL Brener]
MLSRVAAVKAPRTHNRRGVTGSSGGRREGRESERQRPNMSRHLFYSAVALLIVVMMCCNAGGAAEAAGQSPEPKFEWKDVKDEEGVTVESLGAPGLLKAGSDVFAVVEAQCKDGGEKVFTGIASELLTLSDEESKELVTNAVKTQVLEECAFDEKSACHIAGQDDSKTQTRVLLSRPTTVVKGSDIYMLAGNYSWTLAAGVQGADGGYWGLVLVKGNVSKEESQKRIFWNDTYAIPWNYNKQHKSLARLVGSGGSGVKMGDGTLVFPVEGTRKKTTNQVGTEEDEKTVSLIIHSLKDAKSWKLSKGMSDGGCSDPSVVEWKDKKLMMMTACDDGRRRVYESGDKGESWTEALGTLSRVWVNKHEKVKAVRSGFITAKIDSDENNRNVMLVTLPVYSEVTEKGGNVKKGELHLWLTDNTHIVDIGPVSDDDAAASSLLYKSGKGGDNKDELIALYEKKKVDADKTSHSLWSVLLTAQLQRVKEVLATWKKVDETVSKLCLSSAEEDGSPENACSPTVKITDGLVGFLSGNFSGNTWRDEYLGVNATVKKKDDGEAGATKTSDGVKFQGAWAEWPVGAQGENQLYHFANYNFTLVATVSIDGEPQEGSPISLMGVKWIDDKNPVLFGLSYDREKKWQLLCGGGTNTEDQSRTLATEAAHHVVILLRNGTQGSAYVNGQRVLGDAQCDLKNTKDKKISHFYIGGDGSAKADSDVQDVSVTVTNVLLYNRPLNDSEITALNKKLSIPKAKDAKTMKVTAPEASKQATTEAGTPSILGGQQQTEQDPLKKSENAGSGVLSTSAVSIATTSPAAKESEKQSASGTSPSGNKNVDVHSSSEGVQTVDAEAGDTVQGDGTQQPSVGTPATADTNAPTAETMAPDGAAVTPEAGGHTGENGERVGGTDGQKREDIHAQDKEVKAAALSSSLGNVSQGNNSDTGTMRESGMLPSLFLLLGLWVFAAL